jgi:hypothetical protein
MIAPNEAKYSDVSQWHHSISYIWGQRVQQLREWGGRLTLDETFDAGKPHHITPHDAEIGDAADEGLMPEFQEAED